MKSKLTRDGLALAAAFVVSFRAQSRAEHPYFGRTVPCLWRVPSGRRSRHGVHAPDRQPEGTALYASSIFQRGIGVRSLEQLQEQARLLNSSLWHAAQLASGKIAHFVGLIKECKSKR